MGTITVHAPGRVNLIGEHTDYSGGFVLPVAVDRFLTVEAEGGGDTISLLAKGYRQRVEVPADGSETPQRGWGRYVAAVAAELAELGRPPVGLHGSIRSDVPAGVGLSSSAALEVAVAMALCAAADHRVERMELAKAMQRAEHRAVGVPSGIMDQAASLLGKAGHALLLNCTTLEYRHVPIPEHLALVVFDSGVTRRLESSGYAQRRSELEEGLAAFDGAKPAGMRVDEALRRAKQAGVGDVALRRVRHVVSENARVRAMVAALRKGDTATIGRLLVESHLSLRDDFQVTTPELDLLVELAMESGAVGARMTGGGFGGAVLAVAEAKGAMRMGRSVARAYGERVGRPARQMVCAAADGARIG